MGFGLGRIDVSYVEDRGPAMKLLVVEDDDKTVRLLKQGFGENGFVIDDCRTGTDGLHAALSQTYDLIILDVMLPGKDGWEVLDQFRAADRHTPVVMLTVLDSVECRVRGLTGGADDYVVKPFAFSELLARIQGILRRRGSTAAMDILEFQDLVLEPKRFHVARAGRPIELTSKEFLLLELFMRHRGEVLTRAYIAEQVWEMTFDGDSNFVDVSVRRLRAKIDDPFSTKLIQTIRGLGYVLR